MCARLDIFVGKLCWLFWCTEKIENHLLTPVVFVLCALYFFFSFALPCIDRCHNRKESPLYRLPHAVILFVLNMMPWNWNGELNDEEKPKLKEKKPAESQHGGRSYYHRIHREYYNEYDDEEEEEEEEDDDDEEWTLAQAQEEEEQEQEEYVDFGGIAIRKSFLSVYRGCTGTCDECHTQCNR